MVRSMPKYQRPRTCQDARHVDLASAADESSPRYAGWRVVAACYLAALCCWGFGLYGHGVYLTELNRLHGWPTALISAAHHRLLSAHRGAGGVRRRRHRQVRAPAGDADRRLLLRRRGGAARVHQCALAALSGLSADGGRRRDHACRRHQHGGRAVVRQEAPARHQPGAERRKLRRHPDHAAAGAGDRALWIFQRHPRRERGDGGGAAAGDRVLDRPPAAVAAARPDAAPAARRLDAAKRACAARSSGAWRRRSRWH